MKYTNHFTMKNEGWGIKEDQIPSSSHLLHQTMGSQLHILLSVAALNLQKIWFELVFHFFMLRARLLFFVRFRWTFHLTFFFACKFNIV